MTAMPFYYPSCAVNFRIRFEQAIIGGSEPSANSVDDMASNQGIAASIGSTIKQALQPALLAGQADQFSQVFAVVPKKCDVELPGYHQAGKWRMELEFRDFPFDPRAIRALGVEIFLDAVSEDDFAEGLTSTLGVNSKGKTSGRRVSVVNPTDNNLLLSGTGDEMTVEMNDSGTLVHLEGRDLRGIFMDLKIRPSTLQKLKLDERIDDVVSQIVSLVPLGGDIDVQAYDADWPDGVPTVAVQGDLTRVHSGVTGNNPTVKTQGDPNTLSFWDIITQYCFLVGAIPHFIGRTLRIRRARSLFDFQKDDTSSDPTGGGKTPFKGGAKRSLKLVSGAGSKSVDVAYRRMVYGADIHSLKFGRKLGGTKVPVVECVSVDTSNAVRGVSRLITAQWPDEAGTNQRVSGAKVTTVAPSGDTSQTEILRIPVPGISSKARLQEIAKQYREQISRQEVGGSISTMDLSSFGGSNDDPDLLHIQPGDAVEILANANAPYGLPPVVTEITNQASLSEGELASAINARLGDMNIAKVLAHTARQSITALQTTFRVSNVKFAWDSESGVGVDFDFQNYIVARYDVESDSPGG
jgi:hypothetical protein